MSEVELAEKKRALHEAMCNSLIRAVEEAKKDPGLLDEVNDAHNVLLRGTGRRKVEEELRPLYANLPPLPEPVQLFDHDAGRHVTVSLTRDAELLGMPVEMVREQAPEFYAKAKAYRGAYAVNFRRHVLK